MQLGVEISLYPLNEQYVSYIQAFIDRLNSDVKLFVSTTHTSTLISGDYDHVMQVLQREMKRTYEETKQAVFVCKFLNSSHMGLKP
ncbi:YkoF family thiamine/hydroxymethylpyrimidine-binding protein [Glaciecola sp. 2405UD65-10]|uniref:YkoF family thiamine/hydroxymethylpyrimidine-binding protein n=1 Tax=Glaciecola sp. 2405UD65-10 TaxID=3397244 RepID=UPI003B5B6A19